MDYLIRGLYIAASSMKKDSRTVDVISNNLANVNTTGFKKDLVITESFPNVLLTKVNDKSGDGALQRPFRGVTVDNQGEAMTLATEGAYFSVQGRMGISKSKEVKVARDEEGYLRTYSQEKDGSIVTYNGNLVLGARGPINVGEEEFSIDNRGNVIVNGGIIDNLLTFPSINTIGTINGGVRVSEVKTMFYQGQLMETSNPLDFGIMGEGFFAVDMNGTEVYTRDGAFALNKDGILVTKEGYPVLGESGEIIHIGDREVALDSNGNLIAGKDVIDRFKLIDFSNKNHLRKMGDNIYTIAPNTNPQPIEFNGIVSQGYLEGSNVNTIREMVEMITALRAYESSQKVISSLDETLNKVINEVGRV